MGGKLGTPAERFERFYIPEPMSGCWLWLGALDDRGYGQFYHPPRNMVRAHTSAWELYRGPRNGLYVLHGCDNPACVNPRFIAKDYGVSVHLIKNIKYGVTWRHVS